MSTFFVKELSGTNFSFCTLKNWREHRLKTKISQHSFKNKLTKSLGKKPSSTKVLFNLITSSWLLNEPHFNTNKSLQKESLTTQQQFPRCPLCSLEKQGWLGIRKRRLKIGSQKQCSMNFSTTYYFGLPLASGFGSIRGHNDGQTAGFPGEGGHAAPRPEATPWPQPGTHGGVPAWCCLVWHATNWPSRAQVMAGRAERQGPGIPISSGTPPTLLGGAACLLRWRSLWARVPSTLLTLQPMPQPGTAWKSVQ